MKKLLLFFITFTISGMLNAQQTITFTDDNQTFGNVEFPGIWVSIPETSVETVQKSWAKTIQKGTKSKPAIKGQTVSLFGALIPEIYDGPINIESSLKSQDTVVMLFAGVELRRGVLATPGSVEYEKLKSYLKSFAKNQYIEVVKDQISREEKELKAIEKELAKSRKANQRFERKIQSSQSAIAREEDNTLAMRKQLEVANQNIDKASTRLSLTVDPEMQKETRKEIKKLQREKKRLLRKINSSENKISRISTSISDANSSIRTNRRIQEDIGVQVNMQKIKVNELKRKLNTIESW